MTQSLLVYYMCNIGNIYLQYGMDLLMKRVAERHRGRALDFPGSWQCFWLRAAPITFQSFKHEMDLLFRKYGIRVFARSVLCTTCFTKMISTRSVLCYARYDGFINEDSGMWSRGARNSRVLVVFLAARSTYNVLEF